MSGKENNFGKYSINQQKLTFPRPLMDERGKNDLPHGMTKGGEKMELDPKEIQRQQTFDSFCKKVLRHKAANGHREINRRALIGNL